VLVVFVLMSFPAAAKAAGAAAMPAAIAPEVLPVDRPPSAATPIRRYIICIHAY